MSELNKSFEAIVQQEEAYLRRVHPTPADVPSCISHFDNILACHGVRGQLKSLYRYGHRPNCKDKIAEFKFCLSLKWSHEPEERREIWIRRRAEWWAHRRIGRSSEDVWDMRTEPLGPIKPIKDEDIGRRQVN
ncbi:hypothetical protein FISHEDRAFT_46610 [Fistulina hepatica ATCC 64428]|uniref:Uncharacterized protein n=1 Tax=Fistulina hepatica ATCC 64428 TaxID=1128425 RepID=A0A0D7A7N3_9AGAR|nr:hypothetical protein FISHEDRAFT_46610 [Fistulina hepatica ATCC 64428]